MEQNKFRLGGTYRDEGGTVTRLVSHDGSGEAWAQEWGHSSWVGTGYRRLSDGVDTSYFRRDNGALRNLIPGELTLVDGSWVGFDFKREEEKTDVEQALNYAPTKTPTLDKLANTTEPKRPPLDWADDTPFDKFPDFLVTSGTQAQEQSKNTGFPAWRADTAASHLLGGFGGKS